MLLLAAVSLLCGFSRGAALQTRRAALESFLRLVRYCERSLRCLSPEVIPMLRSAGDLGVLNEFVRRCLSLCGETDFHGAYRQAMSVLPRALKTPDRALIAEFGQGLGSGDLSGQLALCALTGERCAELLSSAVREAEQLTRLYLSLGAMGGICAAVLLL